MAILYLDIIFYVKFVTMHARMIFVNFAFLKKALYYT